MIISATRIYIITDRDFPGFLDTEAIAAFDLKEKPNNSAPIIIPIVSEP